MSTSKATYTLNYFNRHGKVELCRLIFAAAQVSYEDNFIENLTDSDTQLGFLPYLQVNEDKIPLISVICRFLAKEFNLAGENNIEQAKSDAIAQEAMLLIDTYFRNVFNVEDLDQKKMNLKDFLQNDCLATADTIENLINLYSSKGSQWCIGDKFTYADLFVYELASRYFPSDDMFIEKYPHIYKIKNTVEESSLASEYIKSTVTQKAKEKREA